MITDRNVGVLSRQPAHQRIAVSGDPNRCESSAPTRHRYRARQVLLQELIPRLPSATRAFTEEAAHPFVSVVGAAWLLMGQPGVTETRAIADTPTPRPPAAGVAGTDIAPTPRVTIIELRRPVRLPHDTPGRTSDRQFSRRWWVGGHWRQQACGPNHSERRPKWIAPYIKGPQDKPLTTERVNVWRR